MASDIKEAIRRMIYQYVVEGADKVMATQEAVAASTTSTDRASLSLEKTFGSLERRYVETVRHQQDYAKVQEKVNAAVAQNPQLQERANALLAAASNHFQNLASRGNFFSDIVLKGFTKFLGPMALVNLALTAIGAVIGYVAAQWESSSKTIEQALTEQNRLMAESKKLIDEKTSAQERMFAQSRETTEFQAAQNLLDLQLKLNKAMEDAARLAEKRTTTPTQVAGEMGEPPTGLAPLAAGYDKVADAVARLREAQAAGLPGLAQFNTELARIGQEYPEIAAEINKLIQANQQFGIANEQALLKARAMSDALKGIATDAQMAAAGLGSIAQFNFSNLQAAAAAEALERMAKHGLALAETYKGMSPDVAKQLELLEAQLKVAQARTKEEELIAQQLVTQIELMQQGRSEEEAMAIAAAQRRVAEENIAKQTATTTQSTRKQSDTQTQYTESQRKEQADVEESFQIRQRNQAVMAERYAAQARRWAAEQQQADEEQEAADQRRAAAMQAYNAMIQQHNQMLAQAQQQAAGLANEWARIPGIWVQIVDHMTDAEIIMHNLPQFQTWVDPNTGQRTQFNPAGYTSTYDPLFSATQKSALEKMFGSQNVEPFFAGVGDALAGYRVSADYWKAQQPAMIGGMDISTPGAASQTLATTLALGLQDGLSNVTRVIDAVADPATQANLVQQAINYVMATQPPNLAREEMLNELNSKLQGLISSTDSLNATMQQALSPFYSQDPRTTHLGFRAGVVGNPEWMVPGASNQNPLAALLGAGATAPGMANGGSFMVGGGYSANDNKIAAFPVASGEEVIVNRNRKGGEGGQVIHIDNRTIINGRVDADVFAQMKVSKYQQTQRMRAGLAVA